MLTEGLGPGAVAVAVIGFAEESDFAGRGNFFSAAAEVGAELGVGRDAEAAVLEIAAEGESKFFFRGQGEIDGLDFPAEALAGAFGELLADAGLVDASAFELGQGEERKELGFDLGERLVMEFEAEAIEHDGADFFADVDDAEVVVAGDVNAREKSGMIE